MWQTWHCMTQMPGQKKIMHFPPELKGILSAKASTRDPVTCMEKPKAHGGSTCAPTGRPRLGLPFECSVQVPDEMMSPLSHWNFPSEGPNTVEQRSHPRCALSKFLTHRIPEENKMVFCLSVWSCLLQNQNKYVWNISTRPQTKLPIVSLFPLLRLTRPSQENPLGPTTISLNSVAPSILWAVGQNLRSFWRLFLSYATPNKPGYPLGSACEIYSESNPFTPPLLLSPRSQSPFSLEILQELPTQQLSRPLLHVVSQPSSAPDVPAASPAPE